MNRLGAGSERSGMRRLPLVLVSLAMTVSVAGCASSAKTAAAPTGGSSGSGGSKITISGFRFGVPDSVAPGSSVSVANADGAAHTVTAADKSFQVPVPGRGSATFTAPAKPGRYPFVCTIHPSMKATLVVR